MQTHLFAKTVCEAQAPHPDFLQLPGPSNFVPEQLQNPPFCKNRLRGKRRVTTGHFPLNSLTASFTFCQWCRCHSQARGGPEMEPKSSDILKPFKTVQLFIRLCTERRQKTAYVNVFLPLQRLSSRAVPLTVTAAATTAITATTIATYSVTVSYLKNCEGTLLQKCPGGRPYHTPSFANFRFQKETYLNNCKPTFLQKCPPRRQHQTPMFANFRFRQKMYLENCKRTFLQKRPPGRNPQNPNLAFFYGKTL